jgi:hypothetical protein
MLRNLDAENMQAELLLEELAAMKLPAASVRGILKILLNFAFFECVYYKKKQNPSES